MSVLDDAVLNFFQACDDEGIIKARSKKNLQNYIDVIIEENSFNGNATDSEKLDCIYDITRTDLNDGEKYQAIVIMINAWRGK